MNRSSLVLACGLLAAASGCSAPKPEPEVATAAWQSVYASRYPEELADLVTTFESRRADAAKIVEAFPGYGKELRGVEPARAEEVYARADAAGRSWEYVERVREVDASYAFFEEEKDELTRRVAGAAQYAVKEKNCDVEVGGAVGHILKETVDDQLEKRLRARNEAHLAIARYKGVLGPQNTEALEKQADRITFASYLVHVELVERKVRLRRLLAEEDAVKKTFSDSLEAEALLEAQAKSDADKRSAKQRSEALTKSRAQLDGALAQGKSLDQKIEADIAESQKKFDDAMAALKAGLKK